MDRTTIDEPLYGLVDIGGTKVVAAIATTSAILGTKRVLTEAVAGADAVTRRVATTVRAVQAEIGLAERPLRGVGVSVPGPLDIRRGIVSFTPNLPGWVDYPVASRLSTELHGVPVFIDDDANCAAMGEAAFGAGRGFDHQVYLTISTGIGGGVVLGGRIYRGFQDAAGEVGHMTIIPGGPECGCGNSGCLEAVASGTAIARRGRQLLVQDQSARLCELAGGIPERVTAAMVFDAARAGDSACAMIVEDAATYLGIGLANIVQLLNPAAIVLGGGVMEQSDFILPLVERRMRTHLFKVQREGVLLLHAALGDLSGLWGALQLVRQETAP
jgi:glucokinase